MNHTTPGHPSILRHPVSASFESSLQRTPRTAFGLLQWVVWEFVIFIAVGHASRDLDVCGPGHCSMSHLWGGWGLLFMFGQHAFMISVWLPPSWTLDYHGTPLVTLLVTKKIELGQEAELVAAFKWKIEFITWTCQAKVSSPFGFLFPLPTAANSGSKFSTKIQKKKRRNTILIVNLCETRNQLVCEYFTSFSCLLFIWQHFPLDRPFRSCEPLGAVSFPSNPLTWPFSAARRLIEN